MTYKYTKLNLNIEHRKNWISDKKNRPDREVPCLACLNDNDN